MFDVQYFDCSDQLQTFNFKLFISYPRPSAFICGYASNSLKDIK